MIDDSDRLKNDTLKKSISSNKVFNHIYTVFWGSDHHKKQSRYGWALVGLTLFWIMTCLKLFWPGYVNPDSVDMLQQARSGHFNNWHSPFFAWLWGVVDQFIPGSGGILIITILMIAIGHLFVGFYFLSDKKYTPSFFIVMALFYPINFLAIISVGKDAILLALLIDVFAVMLAVLKGWVRFSWFMMIALFLIGILIVDVRKNAFLALFPIICLFTSRWFALNAAPVRNVIASFAILVSCVFGAQYIDYSFLRASDAHPQVSLQMFDIGGISYFAHTDASHGLLGRDFAQRNSDCYTPMAWDVYRWGACKDLTTKFFEDNSPAAVTNNRSELNNAWKRAIKEHPTAYLHHRLDHFLIFIHFGCKKCTHYIYDVNWTPTTFIKQAQFNTSWGVLVLQHVANGLTRTPLGYPWVWLIELIICFYICARSAFRQRSLYYALPGMCLAASGLLYECGYFLFGVAVELRYSEWTFVAGLFSAIFAGCVIKKYDHDGSASSINDKLFPQAHRP